MDELNEEANKKKKKKRKKKKIGPTVARKSKLSKGTEFLDLRGEPKTRANCYRNVAFSHFPFWAMISFFFR